MLAKFRNDLVPGELIYVKAAQVDKLADTMASVLGIERRPRRGAAPPNTKKRRWLRRQFRWG
jgi:hypothetical protein